MSRKKKSSDPNTYHDNVSNKTAIQSGLVMDNQLHTPKVCVWDYRDYDYFTFAFISDDHIGHHAQDKDYQKQTLDTIADEEIPFFHMGDMIENATKDSVGAGVYEQELIADEQLEKSYELYQPLALLMKGMQAGNHEMRTMNTSGVNLARVIARQLKVPYYGAGAVHYFLIGDQRYIGYSTHGGSGSTTPSGKLNSLIKLDDIVRNSEIFVQGHVHEAIHHIGETFEFDKKDRTINKKQMHYINNGAMLNYWGTYGQVKSYRPTHKGQAFITLYSGKKHVDVEFR